MLEGRKPGLGRQRPGGAALTSSRAGPTLLRPSVSCLSSQPPNVVAATGGPRRRTPAAGLTSQKRWIPQAANEAAIALAFQVGTSGDPGTAWNNARLCATGLARLPLRAGRALRSNAMCAKYGTAPRRPRGTAFHPSVRVRRWMCRTSVLGEAIDAQPRAAPLYGAVLVLSPGPSPSPLHCIAALLHCFAALQETSMAGLPSLLTAVLLRAAPSCTPAEARPERLPPNFVEVAACVMRVLNNSAR